ncbi:GFA family protein [Sphingorhabdus sp.]|jgi:hypothetical protein|uniref:GFA family protein n=1 Tax=Sphingorhabdus sp. TaxID=1902408 RepID=UPI003BAFA692|nr:GFA family protein [Sphingomonadales bacterium]MBK9433302.1 GFA family protein [Sphingomonadales bacterium]MBL0022619.1 GFA family protein [Sphingomonadales bacterium]
MKVDGACHCGEIAWEAEIDPEAILICHCTDCQIIGGGAFRWGTLIPKDDFTLLRGTPTTYRKIAASGAARALAFCGTCGTSLYGTQADEPTAYSLRLSSARQAKDLRPTRQMWCDSAVAWIDAIPALPKIEQPQIPNS